MFGGLMRILLLFFIGYLVFRLIRSALNLGRRTGRENEGRRREGRYDGRGGKIIELDKDQYKVE
jgi:hypothetical protein